MTDFFKNLFGKKNVEKISEEDLDFLCPKHGKTARTVVTGFSTELDGTYCAGCVIERLVLGLDKLIEVQK